MKNSIFRTFKSFTSKICMKSSRQIYVILIIITIIIIIIIIIVIIIIIIIIFIIVSTFITVSAGVLYVRQPGANHAPRA